MGEQRLDRLAQRDELPMVVVQLAELVLQDRTKPHLDMNERIAKRGLQEGFGMGIVAHVVNYNILKNQILVKYLSGEFVDFLTPLW